MIGDGFNRRDFLKYAGIGSLATNSMSDLVEKRSDAAQVDTQSITGPSQSVTIIPGEDQDLTLIPNLEVAVTILIELESESFTWGDTLATGDAGFEIKYTGFELQGSDTDGPFEINSSSSPLDIENTEEIEAPEQHGITLFLEPTDDDLAEIEVTSPKQDIELPSVSYNIESDPEPSWEYFANIAARRSELFNNYIEAYEGVVTGQAWEQHFAEETADIITTLAVDKSISLATSGVAGLLDSDWLEVAELAYGLRNGLTNTTIARAVKSSFDLAHDQIDHSHRQAVECAGSSDEFLGEVKNLCEQEEAAWRNRDRAEVIATLEEQRAELFDTSTSGESLFQEARYQANYRSNWGRECSAFAFGGDTEDEVRDFFGMVRDFAQDEDKNVADTLRFVRPPNPSVSANRRPEKISARLRDLATGEEDRVKVDFEVSNGSGAGLSSIEGYLSVSYSEYLSVRVESDDEIDTIIHSPDDGSTIIDREGNEITPEYPLLDVFGQYEPGETRIITVAFETEKEEEVDEEDVWFQYRSALQPLLTAEEPGTPASQAEFERAPDPEAGNGFKEDQQGWPARQITAEDAAYPPAARFRVEPTQVAVDEEITLDASESSAEGPIEAYSWDVDTTDDGDFDESYEGETVSVSFANSGRKRVRLTVEDANEETQPVSDTAEITVDPAPPDIVADYTTRPTTPSVDDEVSFISTVDADSYEWEINGTEYTGQTVTKTFSSSGEYDVSHRVGRAGDSDEITSVLTVENVEERLGSPRARIDAPRSLEAGEEGTFDASDSYHPTDELSIDSYEWEIGGESLHGQTVSRTFESSGTYSFELTVVSEGDGGRREDTASATLNVDESDRQPGETPIWFEDGDINIELITQNTKNTLTSQPVTFFANWIEGSVSRSPAGNQIRRAKLNPEKEKGLFLQGYGGFKKNESEPSNADRTNWRYLINDAIYEKQSRSETESTFSIDSGTYAELANDAVSGIESLFTEAESDWLELGDPYWDDNRGAYIIDDASVNLPPEADGDIEASFDEFNVRIESDGVVTDISAALSIDDETEYLTAEAQLPWDGKVSQPNWVEDEELPDLAWKYNTDFDQGPSTNLSYDIDRDHLYTISESSGETQLVAIERESGVKDWEIDIDELQRVQLLQGILLAVDTSGTVYAISPGDGNQIWQIETGEDVLEVDTGRNIFVRSEEKVYAVEPTDGTIHWEVDDPGPILTTPEGLYVKGRRSRLLDLNNGSHIWERTISGSQNPIEVRDGIIYEVDAAGFSVRALDLSDGNHIWGISGRDGPIPDPEGITEIHIIGDQLLLTRGGSRIHAVDIHEGRVSWEFETSSDPTSHSVAFSESNIYMGSSDGVIYSLTFDGSYEKITEIDSGVRQVEVVNDTIFAGTSDELIAIRRDSGELIWQIDVGGRGGLDNWDSIEAFDQFLYVSQRSFSPAFYVLEPESLQNDPAQLPPKPIIAERPPRDLDGNGLYEDINGDGIADVSDVQALHQNLETDSVQDNSEAFNFAGGDPDEVTEADVEALYDRVTGGDSDE